MSFDRKTILITGGTQGLGKELAINLSSLGAKLIIVSRRKEYFEELRNILGDSASFFQADIGSFEQVNDLVNSLSGYKIDILINNAGVWTTNDIEKEDISRRENAIKTNLLGVINMTDGLLSNILKSDEPQILFVNSVAATLGFGGEGFDWSTYNASKWGVKGYMMALKGREDCKGVKIGAVYPGGFESNIYENAGDGQKEEFHNQPWMMDTKTVANAVLFMLNQPADANIDELVITKHSNL